MTSTVRTIGIIGGGQLGRMSAVAAQRLGLRVHILTPEADAPALQVASSATIGAYDDPDVLRRFAEAVDVVTFEFENISAEGLELLETMRPVRPAGRILALSQDRIIEKQSLEAAGLRIAPWKPVHEEAEIDTAVATLGLPLILKSARGGYDGKGQFRIRSADDLACLDRGALPYPMVAEAVVDFARELSVMVARGTDGNCRTFAVTENHHANGILDLSLAPAPVTNDVAADAAALAVQLAMALDLVGIMGVEMFQTSDDALLVNEIAPRPHNSGHWTMNACLIDQFEMHVRAVANLPMPDPSRFADAAMKNLVGPDAMALCPEILQTEGLALHLYGKDSARPGRKMGHVNLIFPKGGLPGPFGIADALGPLAAL